VDMIEPENARLESMPDDRRGALAAVADPDDLRDGCAAVAAATFRRGTVPVFDDGLPDADHERALWRRTGPGGSGFSAAARRRPRLSAGAVF